jgi:[protein-PII] uridylyltransferase
VARQTLDSAGEESPASVQEGHRRFLRLEGERLRMRQRLGLDGLEIATARSHVVDTLLVRVCGAAAERADLSARQELTQCAVVALGGYGRGELAPASDIDLLFLHPGRPTAAVRGFVQEVLQVLWDAGLTVGHSFRSPRECVTAARNDLHSRTALGDARLVAGHAPLFRALLGRLESDLLSSRRGTLAFLDAVRTEVSERQARFGNAVGVIEPNLKESPGGLRDLHAVFWVGYALFRLHGLVGLRDGKLIAEEEYVRLRKAHAFLWRVRHESHLAAGRRGDLLTLDVQPELAQVLGYRPARGLLASEIFMREYYNRAAQIHEFARAFLLRDLEPPSAPSRLGLVLRRVRPGRETAATAATLTRGGPKRLLEALSRAQDEDTPLSPELTLAMRSREPADRAFRASAETSELLVRLLRRRGRVGPALRTLHQTGVLGRLVPEFAGITYLVQHDMFHRYTVDEHTLRAVEALDEVAIGRNPGLARLGRLFDEVDDAAPLYLGMLLHDIGKGKGKGHVERGVRIGTHIVRRLPLDARGAQTVLFLIGAHLEMSQLSQHRDLSEPGVAPAFAERVGSLEHLNMLFLLTYADHCAVGPGIWNDWKASLLWELYERTRPLLVPAEIGTEAPQSGPQDEALSQILRDHPTEDVLPHFSLVPERYFRATDATRILFHLRLLAQRDADGIAVGWQEPPGAHGTEFTVVAPDRRGLFASLAGTFTARGVDVLSVDLFTREDGVALDTFRVAHLPEHAPLEPDRRDRLRQDLAAAAAGRLDVGAAVEKWRAAAPPRTRRHWGRARHEPRVKFDAEGSATATIVEVRAPDRPGLAYLIAHTLSGLGLDISFAKIATAKALAFDVFYVTDGKGRKLSPEGMDEVEGALLHVLAGAPRPRPG